MGWSKDKLAHELLIRKYEQKYVREMREMLLSLSDITKTFYVFILLDINISIMGKMQKMATSAQTQAA